MEHQVVSAGTIAGTTGTFTGDVDIADKIIHTGDTNTAIRFPAADTFTVETGGSERVRIDSSGRLLLGTTTQGEATADDLTIATSGSTGITIRAGTSNASNILFADGTSGDDAQRGIVQYHHSDDTMRLFTNATRRITIDSTGRLLLNTTTEGNAGADDFTIGQISGSTGITIRSGTTNNGNLYFSDGTSGDDEYRGSIQYQHANNSLHIATNAVERIIIDSSGRVLVGHTASLSEGTGFQVVNTSDNTAEFFAYVASSSGSRLTLTKSRSGTKGTNTVVQSGDVLGQIDFRGADGSGYIRGARISAECDGTPGTNDMPGRLVFSTTADGANSQTERLRIDSSGRMGLGTVLQSDAGSAGAGLKIETYLQRNNIYAFPDGYYAASLGEVNNTQTKVWASVDSHYNRTSAVSAGLFLSAFHADAGGSGCGSAIKNLKADNSLTFSTVTTGASVGTVAVETERMRISSAGHVRKPYQPYFHVYGAGGATAYNQNTVIVLTQVSVNTGSNYNTSNGRFTVPTGAAGIYMFTFQFFPNSADTFRVALRRNGTNQTNGYISGHNGSMGAGMSAVSGCMMLSLSEADYVDIVVANGDMSNTYNGHTGFQGYFLG